MAEDDRGPNGDAGATDAGSTDAGSTVAGRDWRQRLGDRDVGLLDWALGSFHAAVLLVCGLLALHLDDGLAGSLGGGTLVGGGLYLLLLASTVTTAWLILGLSGLAEPRTGRRSPREVLATAGWGLLGGAVNGVLFLVGLAVVGTVGILIVDPSDASVIPFVLALGLPVAAVVGLVLGAAFVLVDLLLLWVGESLVPGESL